MATTIRIDRSIYFEIEKEKLNELTISRDELQQQEIHVGDVVTLRRTDTSFPIDVNILGVQWISPEQLTIHFEMVNPRSKRIKNTMKLLKEFAKENMDEKAQEEINRILGDIED